MSLRATTRLREVESVPVWQEMRSEWFGERWLRMTCEACGEGVGHAAGFAGGDNVVVFGHLKWGW